jgi:hypothetical protein
MLIDLKVKYIDFTSKEKKKEMKKEKLLKEMKNVCINKKNEMKFYLVYLISLN